MNGPLARGLGVALLGLPVGCATDTGALPRADGGTVRCETDFNRLKPNMVRVGDVKTFKNFLIPVPASVDPSRYNTVVVWCETFAQFITAAQYK